MHVGVGQAMVGQKVTGGTKEMSDAEFVWVEGDIREVVQKPHGPCAKPHAAPCGFCFPINNVFDPCVDAIECFGSCRLLIRHQAGGASVGNGLFFGSITAIAAQRLWRSQIMTSK
jgi:hypothetical protein